MASALSTWRTVCIALFCYGVIVYARAASRQKRQANPSIPGSGNCHPLAAPGNGTITCGAGFPFYTCNATCNQGYQFPSGQTEDKRDCDQMFGEWFDPGKVIKDCVRSNADCRYHDKLFTFGTVWADVHACSWCECNQYGTQCAAKSGQCDLKNITVSPFDPLCKYNTKMHVIGDVFKTLDGCNTCLCTERGMQCTAHPCKSTGFDTHSAKTLYGECLYGGKWYPLHSHWLADDGCNTCYCYGVGNYRGPHECTTSPCNCSRQSPVMIG